jgi:hypothetical protein
MSAKSGIREHFFDPGGGEPPLPWRGEPVESVVDAHFERVIRIRPQWCGASYTVQPPNATRDSVQSHEHGEKQGRNRIREHQVDVGS